MQAVNTEIYKRLDSEVALIRAIADYLISSGGKRLRPTLLILMANALGYQGNHHRILAAVIEFIHTSTLLHDDVVDESDLRRGRETANVAFGNAASVLVGDYLYSRSFEMMVEVESMRIMQVISQATTVIAEGEVLQLMNLHDVDVTESRYMQVIRYKTAKLFEVATQVAAILAEVEKPVEEAVKAYGRHIGTAFQLVDDVLDYSGNCVSLGKNLGDDLKEGKPTLPLIRLLDVGTVEQQALIRHAIKTGEADFEAVAQVIQSSDALDYAMGKARQEVKLAQAALACLPESVYKDALMRVGQFALERTV
ncbi:octaprenyl diphosphate synthase-like [Globicephala melas]|uniref:octaprenyl diphosphate synthase-like n=1 Tax=Globicephala melas TaxID=9731 RepID=UPI00293D9334|nr:octaprenyl diphosphate synthase-like [Globicephala melas]